jgi:hypothetical protein
MRQCGAILWVFGIVPLWLGLWNGPWAWAEENAATRQLEEKEARECREQMLHVYRAIVRFHDDHKRLPRFLSELLPNYCHLQDLTCPAMKTVGNSDWARQRLLDDALHDPNCPTSTYSYECIEKYWRDHTVTYHEYKRAQREYLDLHGGKGASVPILRCFLHGQDKVINLTFGGQLNVSGTDWEDEFPESRELWIDSLLPETRIRLEDDPPPRPTGLSPLLLDLTTKYNGNVQKSWYQSPLVPEGNFAQLLTEPRFAGGTKFDARGVIQLRGHQLHRLFPLRCKEIKVGQRATRIHFLIGAYGQAPPGERVARFGLNFADRAAASFDVRYAIDVLDWRADPEIPGFELVRDKVAWSSEPVANGGEFARVRLYHFDQVNPNPDAEILSIDCEVSADEGMISEAAPALFAITLER